MSGLAITRRVSESIMIGTDITVTVTQINGSQVRLLIDAPRDVSVDREEIAVRKRQGQPAPAKAS